MAVSRRLCPQPASPAAAARSAMGTGLINLPARRLEPLPSGHRGGRTAHPTPQHGSIPALRRACAPSAPPSPPPPRRAPTAARLHRGSSASPTPSAPGVPHGRASLPAAAPILPRRTSQTHRSEEHTSELQSRENLVCRLLLEKKKKKVKTYR